MRQESAIARQAELIIFNTCPQQEIGGLYAHSVRVVNLDKRPKTLGDARNMAIMYAKGTHIVLLDDDDYMLPSYIETLNKYWTDELDWIVFDKQFLSEGTTIREITPPTANAVCYTKAAFEKIGGYAAKTVGEDTQFIGRLSAQCKGKRVIIQPYEIGFIYGWGQGTYHTSGLGEDSTDKPSAHERVERDFIARVANGSEPVGKVDIKPHCPYNWPEQAKLFLKTKGMSQNNLTDAICVVQLGRYGDIINMLPILKHIHDNYGKPHLMISREFSSVLDGVSYVEPFVVDVPNHLLGDAVAIAKATFKHVICSQIWGRNHLQVRNTDAYNKESWANCGMLKDFNNLLMLPVFDKRDAEREKTLTNYVRSGNEKPFIVVQVTKSISSPFPGGSAIRDAIFQAYSETHNIIDISELRCDRIYDIIGLLDKADCLVSCDTALLHLAAASDVPTVALVNNKPWLGTMLRGYCVARITYDQATADTLQVLGNISMALSNKKPKLVEKMHEFNPIRTAPHRNIYHAFDQRKGQTNASTITRVVNAQLSWDKLYKDGSVIPVPYVSKLRTADKEIGDPRDLPYLKDCLKNALQKAGPEDIILWTNDDNWLHPEITDLIRMHVSLYDVCTSRRCEVTNLLHTKASPEDYKAVHHGHIGRDLFACKASWLQHNWDSIPDFILGASAFDLILAYIVREYHGVTLRQSSSLDENVFPAELPLGYVAHVKHDNYWSKPENYHSPSETHNRRLYEEFVAAMKKRIGL